jgi:hypothetical protein
VPACRCLPIVSTKAYPSSIDNVGLSVLRANMKYIDYAAYLMLAVCIGSYFYSMGYKDGKREAQFMASKWRKVSNDN